VRFGSNSLEKAVTSPTVGQKKAVPNRRHSSHDAKVNVYTECGRHSDDWLFGGFSVAGAVKKLWDKKE